MTNPIQVHSGCPDLSKGGLGRDEPCNVSLCNAALSDESRQFGTPIAVLLASRLR